MCCVATATTILLTKTTAAQNEVALSYHGMRGLYFLAVVFASTIELSSCYNIRIFQLFLNSANFYGYIKCRKDAKAKVQGAVGAF